jgi:signal transduction histidine kinase
VTTVLDELLTYVELGDADRARLVALHPRLEPHFSAIAERFYQAVFANPHTTAILSGPAQVERLRVTLIDWMSTGLLGPYDQAFFDKRSRIGRRHVDIGLAQQYMFTAMDVVRIAYLDQISKLYEPDEAFAVMRAVHKLFDVELALMLASYQRDSEDRLLSRERRIQADRITALRTMTAGLAHEVRNPLNAAKLQLELLQRRLRRLGDNAKLTEPTELAHQEIGRLSQLLDEFLAFARPPEIHALSHDVVAIVRHVIELERPFAESSNTELALAPASEVAMAEVDAGKLHQIVQNLVRNAVEAAAPNGHVTVSIAVDDARLRLRVADDGPGISADVRQRIYEPFFSTKESGTGMGMSIVHNFVAMHGGTIDIASGDTGATVEVAIPRRRAA